MTDSVRFGVLSDLQYWNGEVYKDRHFRNSLQKLSECQQVFNSQPLDFVIDLGDLIDRDYRSYDVILPAFENFKARIFHVLGNHDYAVDEGFKTQLAKRIGLKNNYYSFESNGYLFVVLDGNEVSTFANPEGSANYLLAEQWLHELEGRHCLNARFWNGGIGETQLAWLEGELKVAEQTGKRTVVFCHYPVFPDDRHNLLNEHEILQLLQKFNGVMAWFCGHNHDGNYGKLSGIHFVNMAGMVETAREPAFSIVEINAQGMEITGFGRERSRKLYL